MEYVITSPSGNIIRTDGWTLQDFQMISSFVEDENDADLYNYLVNNINGYNSIDKFFTLLYLRKKCVDDTIVISTSDKKSITIFLKIWLESFFKNYKNIRKVLTIDDFTLTLDYPLDFIHYTYEELLVDCIYELKYKDIDIFTKDSNKSEKNNIIGMLPAKVVTYVKNFIDDNNHPIVIMDSKIGLDSIQINFFDNSPLALITTLYNYHTYDEILEMLFVLSKRIPDISFLNSRSPKDLKYWIQLYSEEVEKINHSTKS